LVPPLFFIRTLLGKFGKMVIGALVLSIIWGIIAAVVSVFLEKDWVQTMWNSIWSNSPPMVTFWTQMLTFGIFSAIIVFLMAMFSAFIILLLIAGLLYVFL